MYITMTCSSAMSPRGHAVRVKLPTPISPADSDEDEDAAEDNRIAAASLVYVFPWQPEEDQRYPDCDKDFFENAVALSDKLANQIKEAVDNLVISKLTWVDYPYCDGSHTRIRIYLRLVTIDISWANRAPEGMESLTNLVWALRSAMGEYHRQTK